MIYDCGKYKITLKKIIRRLEDIPDDSRNMWLSEILSHFGNRYGGFKYAQGFEQGLLEGFQNGLNELNKKRLLCKFLKLLQIGLNTVRS